MTTSERMRKKIAAQLTVNTNRLERRLRRLPTEDVLSLYEEASNLYFHGDTLAKRTRGADVLNAAVSVLGGRYDAIRDLDLMQPFPLRDWVNGVPRSS